MCAKCAPSRFFANFAKARFQSALTVGETGKPFSAYHAAGARTSSSGRRPKRRFSSAQPAGAPGTIVGSQPSLGISRKPRARTFAALRAAGAVPLALRP